MEGIMNQDLSKTLGYILTNNAHNIYKESIPANLRMAMKSIVNPTPVNENNFTRKELELMKKVRTNSANRSSTPGAKTAQDVMSILKTLNKNTKVKSPFQNNANSQIYADEAYQALKEQYDPSLQYADYPREGYMNSKHPIVSSYSSPSYALANTIGRAIYNKDNKGNTIISDTYDMPSLSDKENFKRNTSKGMQITHELIRRYGKPMPVNINLGKI